MKRLLFTSRRLSVASVAQSKYAQLFDAAADVSKDNQYGQLFTFC